MTLSRLYVRDINKVKNQKDFSKMKTKGLLLLLIIICSTLNAIERHIALIMRRDFRGEVSFAYRIKSACKNIHWEADVIDIQNPEKLKVNKYDFVINLVPCSYRYPACKNYLAIFDPINHYFNENGFLHREYCFYDGYLLTYSPDSFGNKKKTLLITINSPTCDGIPLSKS